jgi:hypothetical protein
VSAFPRCRPASIPSTVGVAQTSHTEPSFPFVWGARFFRLKTVPRSIVPRVGQSLDDGIESPNIDGRDVLQQEPSRSYVANESEEVKPESGSLAFESFPWACDTDVLAGESCAEPDGSSSSQSAQRFDHSSWDRSNVREHRARIQSPRFHLVNQVTAGEGFPFHSKDSSSVSAIKSKSKSFAKGAGSGKEFDHVEGIIHIPSGSDMTIETLLRYDSACSASDSFSF